MLSYIYCIHESTTLMGIQQMVHQLHHRLVGAAQWDMHAARSSHNFFGMTIPIPTCTYYLPTPKINEYIYPPTTT